MKWPPLIVITLIKHVRNLRNGSCAKEFGDSAPSEENDRIESTTDPSLLEFSLRGYNIFPCINVYQARIR